MVATAPCPTLEEIAAFLDGALQGEDRDRVVQHLNECPDCHELFVETAEILDECGAVRPAAPPAPEPAPAAERGEARILQHRRRGSGGFWRLGLPLAAALVALVGGYVGLGFATNRPQLLDGRAQMAEHIAFWVPFDYFWVAVNNPLPALESTDQLAFDLTPPERENFLARVQEEILPPVMRGGESAGKEFELGSALVSYDLFRASGDGETLDGNIRPGVVKALVALAAEGYQPPEACSPLLPTDEASNRPRLSDAQRPSQFAACVSDVRVALGDFPDFLLGEWTQGARIALLADRLSFFTADGRRVPAWRLRQAGSFWQWVTRREEFPLPPDVEPILKSLQDLVGDGVTPEEKIQVQEKLKDLADTYAAFADGE